MADKTPVVVNTPKVAKSFDAKVTKSAPDFFCKVLTKAVGSSALEVVSRLPSKDKGFEVNPTIQEITLDEKKKALAAKVQLELSELPGPKMFSSANGKAAVTGYDPKKPDAALKDLMEALAEDLGAKAAKAMEQRAGA